MYTNNKDKYTSVDMYIQGMLDAGVYPEDVFWMAVTKFGDAYKDITYNIIRLRTETDDVITLLKTCLNGRDMDTGLFQAEIDAAKNAGIAIISGYSDDVIEIDGALFGEGDVWDNTAFHFEKEFNVWTLKDGYADKNYVRAMWYDRSITTDDGEIIPWTYQTNIPHQNFYMTIGGEPWCIGLLFYVHDLKL